MTNVVLSTGARMPLVGLGTWQSKPDQVRQAVRTALDAGYRHIDTAFVYANEKEIGQILTEYFDTGKLKREDVFITTKLWVTYHKRELVTVCMKKSLANLQLDYVDMYLMHQPCGFEKAKDHDNMALNEKGKPFSDGMDLLDTWKGMEDVYNAGLAKAIGVSNFNAEQVSRVCKGATVKPDNNQVECHLYFPQFELHKVCKKLGVSFTAYAPLGSPGRINFQPPKGRAAIDWKQETPQSLEDSNVKRLAEKYNKTCAQIILRWFIQRDIIVIPKSVTPSRVVENFQVFDFQLSEAEMECLNDRKINQRLFYQNFLVGHPEDPHASER